MAKGYFKGADGSLKELTNVHFQNDTDYSLGLTAVASGDLIKVKAVSPAGVPTEWEKTSLEELEGKWEVIEEVTTNADAVFSRAAEPDGTAYSFKALRFNFELPTPHSGNTKSYSFVALFSGDRVGLCDGIFRTSDQKFTGEITPKFGNWQSFSYDPVPKNYQSTSGFYSFESPAVKGPISKFQSNSAIPANTKIKIEAVRA